MMNTNRLSNKKIKLNNVIKNKSMFIGAMKAKEFEKTFGVQINYLDLNIEENKQKNPSYLNVAINLTDGDLAYNSETKELIFEGEYDFIDGLKKFEIMQVHPDSKIQVGATTYNKEEVRRYLSEIKYFE